jgi:hypothetical protein
MGTRQEGSPAQGQSSENRYAGAGVKRQAFLFPKGARTPPMRSSPEEKFLTETFDDVQKAEAWLTAG